MKYNLSIDGLRALAVLPVIFFHADYALFPGGFVGVDVFFVISGYLITALLVGEMAADRFSLVSFYERRARRILPALFLVLGASVLAAWVWLMPDDMQSFAGSLSAVSLFGSNVFFWRTSGYFDAASDLKPLLHTWSLGVEEQYYFVFPLLLLLLRKHSRALAVITLTALSAISLWAAQRFVVQQPEAVFYLLPTRAWELGLGALLALYHVKQAPRGSEPLAIVGLLLIGVAVATFSASLPAPSLYTLVPTLGTALVIHAASGATVVGRLLSSRPLVGVGLISYSAYLWHQPLFAFAKHQNFGTPRPGVMGALVVLTLVLAWLSWRFVEMPFRDLTRFRRKQVFTVSLVGSLGFLAIGVAGQTTNGFELRVSADKREFLDSFSMQRPEWRYVITEGLQEKFRTQCDFYDLDRHRARLPTHVPRPRIAPECYQPNGARHTVFIWGDSHAQQLFFGLARTLPSDWQILQVASSACPPRLNAESSAEQFCDQSNWFARQVVARTKPDVVIVGQNAGHDSKAMAAIARDLRAAGVGRVLFTGPTPHWRTRLPKIVAFRFWESTPRRTWTGVDREMLERSKALVHVPGYVSLTDYFCNDAGCLVYYGNDRRKGVTSFDYGHLTPVASLHLARDLLVPLLLGFPHDDHRHGRPAQEAPAASPQ